MWGRVGGEREVVLSESPIGHAKPGGILIK